MFLILFCCVCGAIAVPIPQNYNQRPSSNVNPAVVPIVEESNEINPDGSFSYSYTTGDGQQAQAQGYLKNPGNKDTEAEVIQGSYSYTAPDGTPITVTYIADEFGFRVQGAHIPTPPPIPEAIQQSLAQLPQTQKPGKAKVPFPQPTYKPQRPRPFRY